MALNFEEIYSLFGDGLEEKRRKEIRIAAMLLTMYSPSQLFRRSSLTLDELEKIENYLIENGYKRWNKWSWKK